ncbi:putative Type ii collagen, partial [Daphnia magna]
MITVMDGHKNINHVEDHCLDFQNVTIPSGSTYIPGSDPCVLCLCEHGKNLWCQAVRCAASEVT